MQERRKSFRSRVLKSAKIVVGSSSVIDCVVHNLTNVGARVEVSNSASLPENIHLTFDRGRSLRPCRIIWRKVDATGLEFVSANER